MFVVWFLPVLRVGVVHPLHLGYLRVGSFVARVWFVGPLGFWSPPGMAPLLLSVLGRGGLGLGLTTVVVVPGVA